MKKFDSLTKTLPAAILTLSLLASPAAGFCSLLDVFSKDKEAAPEETQHRYQTIDAKELKGWIDSGKKFELVDARPKKYAEGDVIIGARYLPYDSDEKAIAKALPSKDATIVAYCASEKCPASGYLSDTLIDLGYKNVYKYPGGIADWEDRRYPMGPAKNKVK